MQDGREVRGNQERYMFDIEKWWLFIILNIFLISEKFEQNPGEDGGVECWFFRCSLEMEDGGGWWVI